MFLDKKECDFFKLLGKNESAYKIGRPIYSTVTITKKLNTFKKMNLITIELVGRINEIKFTDEGKEVLKSINKIMMLCH